MSASPASPPPPLAAAADPASAGRARWLFLGALYLLLLVPGWGDNESRTHALLWSLTTRGTLFIEGAPFPTGDVATAGGHVYAAGAPGLAFFALPAYAPVRALAVPGLGPVWGDLVAFLAAIVLGAVAPSLLAARAFAALVRADGDAGEPTGQAVLLFAAGSLLLPYGSRLMAHALVAGGLTVALWAVDRALRGGGGRPGLAMAALAGTGAGLATTADYPAAVPAAALGLLLLLAGPGEVRGRAARLVAFAAGAAPWAALLALYHRAAFGGPFTTPYHHSANATIQATLDAGWLGYELPSPGVIAELTVGSRVGLFVYCPVALAGLLGAGRAARDPDPALRRQAWTCLGVVAVLLLLVAARQRDYHAGHVYGPRYLLVALPFALRFLARGLGALPRPAGLGLATAGYLMAFLGAMSCAHVYATRPGGATLAERAGDVLEAGPRLCWLLPLASEGLVAPARVPLLSGLALVALGGATAALARRHDRPLAAVGLGLAGGALVLLA